MAEQIETKDDAQPKVRAYPKIETGEEGELVVSAMTENTLRDLTGMKTSSASSGVFCSALEALGATAENKASIASAMFAEIEPKDAVEAMLVAQMTATHIAMTKMSERMSYQKERIHRESYERSMCRLGRLFTTQVDTLNKYRRKAQQVVRVERVTVNEGGQAIVGDVVRARGA